MKKSLLFRNGDSSFCKIYLLVCLLLVGFINLNAQEAPNKKVSLDLKNVPLIDVLLDIQKQTGVNFAYEKTQVEQFKPVTISIKGATVEEVLKIILKDTGFTYKITGNNIAIVKQQETSTVKLIQVSGKVTDEKGNSIPGATVIIHGTTQGVATDVDGRYTLAVKPDDVLRVSFVGYKPEVVPIKGKTKVNVALNPTAENIEEVQVVAFGTQKKESVVSAITTVRPMDLKSSSSDLTSSLAGRVAGIIGWQTGGMPGALTEEEMNTKFYVRGITSFNQNASSEPLILIDGVESSKLDLSRMAPEDIETFSVLKDASATAMYGARGANGIIVVTTKKGQEGSVYATARYEAVFSMPTKEIEVVDPITWMKMYNQALLTRNPNATPKYSVEQINRTASGKYPDWLYPANDWYDMMIKDYTLNHRFGLNIRGGSKILQYYASVNYNRDLGQQKTDKLNDFEVGIKSNSTTFRANLTINLKAGIQLLINSATTFDKYHGPMVGASS
ncbi:MAG: SusC/RagA family TonB-linked outer membrane protein, partial [Butyricimonas faecihominis]